MFQVNFRSTKLTLIYFLEKLFKILKSPESKIYFLRLFFEPFNDFRSAVILNLNKYLMINLILVVYKS